MHHQVNRSSLPPPPAGSGPLHKYEAHEFNHPTPRRAPKHGTEHDPDPQRPDRSNPFDFNQIGCSVIRWSVPNNNNNNRSSRRRFKTQIHAWAALHHYPSHQRFFNHRVQGQAQSGGVSNGLPARPPPHPCCHGELFALLGHHAALQQARHALRSVHPSCHSSISLPCFDLSCSPVTLTLSRAQPQPTAVPVPSFVTVVQLLFAVVIILALQAVHAVPKDPLEWNKVKVRPT